MVAEQIQIIAIHSLDETAEYLYREGLTPTRLDKAAVYRFEQRLLAKLRRHPIVRQVYRDMFHRVPPSQN